MLDEKINIMVDRTICYRPVEGKQRIYHISINGNYINHELSLKEITTLRALLTHIIYDEKREMSRVYKQVIEST